MECAAIAQRLGHFLEWHETVGIFLFVTQLNIQIADQMCRHTERADSLKMVSI
jgi:hypothetical protein